MGALPAGRLLEVLERGRHASGTERGLLLLATALPGVGGEALAAIPVGRRDARLLELRRRAFGESMEAVVDCPSCGERMELDFTVSDILLPEPEAPAPEVTVEGEGRRLRVRPPDSADLLAAEADPWQGRAILLRRCVTEVPGDEGGAARRGGLGEALEAAVTRAMEESDPQGAMRITTTCPACGEGWAGGFDILSWLWAELEGWGGRMLGEVAFLARAYGWSEREILEMGEWRRRRYLELAGR